MYPLLALLCVYEVWCFYEVSIHSVKCTAARPDYFAIMAPVRMAGQLINPKVCPEGPAVGLAGGVAERRADGPTGRLADGRAGRVAEWLAEEEEGLAEERL